METISILLNPDLDSVEKVGWTVAIVLAFITSVFGRGAQRPDDSFLMKYLLAFSRTMGVFTAALTITILRRIVLLILN